MEFSEYRLMRLRWALECLETEIAMAQSIGNLDDYIDALRWEKAELTTSILEAEHYREER